MKAHWRLALLLALGACAPVAAQGTDPAIPPVPQSEPQPVTTGDQAAENPGVAPSLEEAPGEVALSGADDDADSDGAADDEKAAGDEEASDQGVAESGQVKASMERFVPSERISEDRSVSFPNDI